MPARCSRTARDLSARAAGRGCAGKDEADGGRRRGGAAAAAPAAAARGDRRSGSAKRLRGCDASTDDG
eukprot:gene8887-14253_t